eukprot:IDg8347t1
MVYPGCDAQQRDCATVSATVVTVGTDVSDVRRVAAMSSSMSDRRPPARRAVVSVRDWRGGGLKLLQSGTVAEVTRSSVSERLVAKATNSGRSERRAWRW